MTNAQGNAARSFSVHILKELITRTAEVNTVVIMQILQSLNGFILGSSRLDNFRKIWIALV